MRRRIDGAIGKGEPLRLRERGWRLSSVRGAATCDSRSNLKRRFDNRIVCLIDVRSPRIQSARTRAATTTTSARQECAVCAPGGTEGAKVARPPPPVEPTTTRAAVIRPSVPPRLCVAERTPYKYVKPTDLSCVLRLFAARSSRRSQSVAGPSNPASYRLAPRSVYGLPQPARAHADVAARA